jgi:formyl-CoA transferase
VALSASSQSIFERLARAMGCPELISDPRFVDNQARVRHIEALEAIIGGWMLARPRSEVLAAMETAEVAVGPIYDIPSVFADPQFQARGSFATVDDASLGPMQLVNVAPRLSATPGRIRHTGPALGEHNAEVFRELGLDAGEVDQVAEGHR